MTLPDAARVDTSLPRLEHGQGRLDAVGQLAGLEPVEQRLPLGVRRGPRVEADSATRRAARRRARRALRVCAMTSSATSKFCSGSKPSTSLIAASSSAPRAEPWILPVFCLFGARPADDRLQDDERRLVGLALRRLDRGVELGDVLDVLAGLLPVDGLHVPAVRLVALGDVFGEGDVGVVFDRDLVGVVDHDEVAELLVTGERGCLARDALLQVAVAGDDVDEVVERARARLRHPGRTGRARSARRRRSRPRRRGPGRAGRW